MNITLLAFRIVVLIATLILIIKHANSVVHISENYVQCAPILVV